LSCCTCTGSKMPGESLLKQWSPGISRGRAVIRSLAWLPLRSESFFFVNAALLVMAAATFHRWGHYEVAEIQDAHRLLEPPHAPRHIAAAVDFSLAETAVPSAKRKNRSGRQSRSEGIRLPFSRCPDTRAQRVEPVRSCSGTPVLKMTLDTVLSFLKRIALRRVKGHIEDRQRNRRTRGGTA
jgi:hypothetical protein